MPETCAIDLHVVLPRAIAAELEDAQWRDPELLTWILCQGFARSAGLGAEEIAEIEEWVARRSEER
jgi:hypothetical protein